ncbi:large conductance mechanosensitive channel protein [Raphidocelis subcapitata]|uniref:Large conductance mechanosensitive channel protein n=1 Tax=Raphidocelis subcapitata TaxID=307507 RepID=A0A2V0NPH2_9CHLO|nr:large conductance mechanosensitive channel protein [Raphidocelis subcapitata]|eukprot:GBF89169.1 large conductance mechanosensitive channel protein [Raphidocelis subcapitata]
MTGSAPPPAAAAAPPPLAASGGPGPARFTSGVTSLTKSVSGGLGKAVDRVGSGVGGVAKSVGSGVGGVAKTGVGAAVSGVTAGLKGFMSSGRGFREFLLKGPVVELAVAVVVGMAFTDLVNAIVKSFITPLIAAIFRGVSFSDLYFELNSSRFMYGSAINALFVFLLVLTFTYFGIMRPLQHFTNLWYPNRAETKDCVKCLSEIPLAATRCKFCGADIELDEDTLAEMERCAEERMFSGNGLCGCAPCFAVGRTVMKAGKSVVDCVCGNSSQPPAAGAAAGAGAGAAEELELVIDGGPGGANANGAGKGAPAAPAGAAAGDGDGNASGDGFSEVGGAGSGATSFKSARGSDLEAAMAAASDAAAAAEEGRAAAHPGHRHQVGR